jgi:type VI secretion system secreted protein VgrG
MVAIHSLRGQRRFLHRRMPRGNSRGYVMKTKPLFPAIRLAVLLTIVTFQPAFAQGTSFTYQGRLNNGSSAANGSFDLTFALFTTNTGGAAIAGPLTNGAVAVSNGLFTTFIDFGPGPWIGGNNWLEIGVRSNGVASFTALTPRQQITPTPYAVTAEAVIAGGITSGMLADGAVTGRKIDDGGATAFQSFQQIAQSNGGGDSAVPFSGLSLFPPATIPSLALSINGSSFGTVIGFSGAEALSTPYSFLIEVQSAGIAVDPDSKIGQTAQLTFTRNGRSTAFGGVVTGCSLSGSSSSGLLYLVRIESSLSYLALSKDYNLFQNQTAPGAAASIYHTISGNTASQTLAASYAAHEALIQYAETDLNFFNRVLENEGVFYLFNQSASPPSLILGDSASAYLAAPNSPFLYYGNTSTNPPAGAEFIRAFSKAVHQSTLKSTVNNYDFTAPSQSVTASASAAEGLGENYDFGSGIATAAFDQQLANVRADRESVERALIAGSSTAPDLRPGYTFSLTDLTGAGLGGSYVVTSVHHAGFVRVTNGVSSFFYGNQFEAVPAAQNYRPALAAPKPLAEPCTAVVTGPAGATINSDKYGRVKVQFHWDRRGHFDLNSSGWVRVASPVAGADHAMLFLPHIGDEVLVSFIQGDPDRPVITGSLLNGDAMPPYTLSAGRNISTIQSVATDGLMNEIKFDDTAGAQNFSLQAAKDMNTTVANNFTLTANAMTFRPVSSLSITGNVAVGLTTPSARLEVSSSGNNGAPQLRLDQTLSADFARIRLVSGNAANGVWDIAAGGSSPNVLNFFVSPGVALAGTNILTLHANGSATLSGTLAQGSDRAHKENLQPVDPQTVLDKVSQLPITRWNYITEPGVDHLGPMAQDFYGLFRLGADDKHITTVDEGGVTLAAIQALARQLKEKDAEIQALQRRLEKLEQQHPK